jgi:integrase
MAIGQVKRSDIVRWLDRIADERGPVSANRALGALRRVFNFHAIRSDDFRSPIVRGMERAEKARDRVLSDDELKAVWAAASGAFGDFVKFLLLTAARRDEARLMTWTEIAKGQWVLPAGRNKVGVELVRPLSRPALAIVEAQPRLGEFVFSRSSKGPIGGLTELKVRLDYASGTSGWTLHDLRRTSRSLMSRAGVPSDHAERCLGHVIPGIRSVYDRHKYREEMLMAYEKLSALIRGIVDPQPNIVAIRGQAQ